VERILSILANLFPKSDIMFFFFEKGWSSSGLFFIFLGIKFFCDLSYGFDAGCCIL